MAAYLRRARVEGAAEGFPFDLPAVAALGEIDFDAPATFIVGENGTGKSTLVEAIALAAGCNAHGGSHNVRTASHGTESILHEHLRLAWRRRPPSRYFLRAETHLDALAAYDRIGGRYAGLTERSHGESVLGLAERLDGRGLLLLGDEPEAGLSVTGQLALLRRSHELVNAGAQLVVATHSPILTALPGAVIWELDDDGARRVDWEDTDAVVLLRSFVGAPDAYLERLLRR